MLARLIFDTQLQEQLYGALGTFFFQSSVNSGWDGKSEQCAFQREKGAYFCKCNLKKTDHLESKVSTFKVSVLIWTW